MTWADFIRQLLLRGNFFKGDAAALVTLYNTGTFSDAQIVKDGAEFSFNAIIDAILQAHVMMVEAIGQSRDNSLRAWLTVETGNIAPGGAIPTAISGAARYGIISDVVDATNATPLTPQPRKVVEIARKGHGRSIVPKYYYFTDDVYIWHTRTNVRGRIVAFDRTAERTAMINSNNSATIKLPTGILPDLEHGALAFIYRDTFRIEQAMEHWKIFDQALGRISPKHVHAAEMPPKM